MGRTGRDPAAVSAGRSPCHLAGDSVQPLAVPVGEQAQPVCMGHHDADAPVPALFEEMVEAGKLQCRIFLRIRTETARRRIRLSLPQRIHIRTECCKRRQADGGQHRAASADLWRNRRTRRTLGAHHLAQPAMLRIGDHPWAPPCLFGSQVPRQPIPQNGVLTDCLDGSARLADAQQQRGCTARLATNQPLLMVGIDVFDEVQMRT